MSSFFEGEDGVCRFEALRVSGRLFLLCTGTGVVPFISGRGCVGWSVGSGTVWTWRLREVPTLTCGKVEELQYLKHKVAQLVRAVSLPRNQSFSERQSDFMSNVMQESYPFKSRIASRRFSWISARRRRLLYGARLLGNGGRRNGSSQGISYREDTAGRLCTFVYEKVFAVWDSMCRTSTSGCCRLISGEAWLSRHTASKRESEA
ncbi:MAG: hypothetical protein ACKERG_00470 [Candidatus Hodgkinia cicadicola]